MNPLKILVDEAQSLVDENRQYEKRFQDLISEMNNELHRLMRESNGSVEASLDGKKHENWGYNLALKIKTGIVTTSHQVYIIQTGRGEYLMSDGHSNEGTVRDGAAASNMLLGWLINRIKEQRGELAGGTLTSRVFN